MVQCIAPERYQARGADAEGARALGFLSARMRFASSLVSLRPGLPRRARPPLRPRATACGFFICRLPLPLRFAPRSLSGFSRSALRWFRSLSVPLSSRSGFLACLTLHLALHVSRDLKIRVPNRFQTVTLVMFHVEHTKVLKSVFPIGKSGFDPRHRHQ